LAKTNTALIFLHQKRQNLDPYSGELETYSGGNALRHWVSLVLHQRRASAGQDPDAGKRFKSDADTKLGFMVKFKANKATVGTICEGESFELDFYNGKGIDNVGSVVYYALRRKILQRAGRPGTYAFSDSKGTYEQFGIGSVLKDAADNTNGIYTRLLDHIKAKRNTVEAVEVAPDLQFEAEVIQKNMAEMALKNETEVIDDTPVVVEESKQQEVVNEPSPKKKSGKKSMD
jgi:hypothetical protein